MSELQQARARILAQQIQITRLHTALTAIAASADLTDPQVAMARAALEACEADAGQIAADVRALLSGADGGEGSDVAAMARARLAGLFGGA